MATRHVRTLKELDYSEETDSFLLGFEFASADTEHGRLSVIGAGDTVRFTLAGREGYVELNLDRFAGAAIAWLTREDGDGQERAA